jgi:hypothetical protein
MNVEVFLGRLKGVRRSGDGWIARCPAHGDRNPSLSICERDQKILLYCHAGCSVEAVCAAMRIRVSDLFAAPRDFRNSEPDIVRYAHRQIAGLRSRLTPAERERPTTVVLASLENPDPAIARALALAVEGEIVQVTLKDSRV